MKASDKRLYLVLDGRLNFITNNEIRTVEGFLKYAASQRELLDGDCNYFNPENVRVIYCYDLKLSTKYGNLTVNDNDFRNFSINTDLGDTIIIVSDRIKQKKLNDNTFVFCSPDKKIVGANNRFILSGVTFETDPIEVNIWSNIYDKLKFILVYASLTKNWNNKIYSILKFLSMFNSGMYGIRGQYNNYTPTEVVAIFNFKFILTGLLKAYSRATTDKLRNRLKKSITKFLENEPIMMVFEEPSSIFTYIADAIYLDRMPLTTQLDHNGFQELNRLISDVKEKAKEDVYCKSITHLDYFIRGLISMMLNDVVGEYVTLTNKSNSEVDWRLLIINYHSDIDYSAIQFVSRYMEHYVGYYVVNPVNDTIRYPINNMYIFKEFNNIKLNKFIQDNIVNGRDIHIHYVTDHNNYIPNLES